MKVAYTICYSCMGSLTAWAAISLATALLLVPISSVCLVVVREIWFRAGSFYCRCWLAWNIHLLFHSKCALSNGESGPWSKGTGVSASFHRLHFIHLDLCYSTIDWPAFHAQPRRISWKSEFISTFYSTGFSHKNIIIIINENMKWISSFHSISS